MHFVTFGLIQANCLPLFCSKLICCWPHTFYIYHTDKNLSQNLELFEDIAIMRDKKYVHPQQDRELLLTSTLHPICITASVTKDDIQYLFHERIVIFM